MRILQCMAIAAAVAMPASVVAAGAPPTPQEKPQEKPQEQPEEQPQEQPEETKKTQPPEAKAEKEAKKTETTPSMDEQAQVKTYVLPISVGIRSAQTSADVLGMLAEMESFDHRNARKLAEFAEQSVELAHDRSEKLADVEGLSSTARTDAKSATKKLDDARSTVKKLKRSVGVIKGTFGEAEAQQVGTLASALSSELDDAEQSIQKIADTYAITTGLERPSEVARGPR